MKVVFRVDSSIQMGAGHLVRCLTLAEALRIRGIDIRFVCRAHPGHLVELLQRRCMAVAVLPTPERIQQDSEDYAEWLGVTQVEDAEQTIDALRGECPDWLIVDHYGLDANWEQTLRSHIKNLLVIDDLANRQHVCDLLLDQNYSNRADERYKSLVPATCTLLLGPRFALLRPEYIHYRKSRRSYDGQVRRVLIYFGGSDRHDLTGITLDALSGADLGYLQVDIVVGVNNPHRAALERRAYARPLTKLYEPRMHLADLMAQADLSIGAGGTTTWERMCLGLPTLVVSIAKNQAPACQALSEAGLIRYLGTNREVRASHIADEIRALVAKPDCLAELSTGSQLTVDGLGAMRLVECLDATSAEALRLRPASIDDMCLYFRWVNDSEARKQSIHSERIELTKHRQWFADRLAATECSLFVMQAGNLPVGQIRFDREGDEARIDYSIDCLFRGRGWAKHLVALGMQQMQVRETIGFRADVKESNLPSIAVFKRLGFVETSTSDRDLKTFVFDPSIHRSGIAILCV